MKYNTRFARSLVAILLVVASLASVCACAFAANDIYFPRYTGSSGSIVTALNAIGVDSSYGNRSKIAAANSIQNYKGTAAQNTQMVNLLKAGKLIDPVKQANNQNNNQNNNQSSTSYFPRYTGSSGSIVTALNAIGVDSSYSNRSKIAAANNIQNYKGTAAQNTQMVNLLKAGKLINPAKTSSGSNTSTPSTNSDPTAAYTSTVYNTSDYMMTNTGSVKVRTGAWVLSSVYVTLDKGTLVSTSGVEKNTLGSWYVVKINGTKYYVQQSQLSNVGNTTVSSLVKLSKNAVLRNAPYETGSVVKDLQEGTILQTVGSCTNKHGNLWYVVKLQNDNTLYYMYSGNVQKSYSKNGNVYLDVATQFQTTNYTCSAAAAQAVLRYYNTALDKADTDLYKSTDGYVGKTCDTVNSYLGSTYKYSTFGSVASYETAIRSSLAQGSLVIARVQFPAKYFNYKSNGHYTTVVGIYTDSNGTTWLKIVDSFVNRNKSNSYSNRDTGVVTVPLSTMYTYGQYGGTSPVYLIYND